MGGNLLSTENPEGSDSSEENKAHCVRGHAGAGVVGELKELQINILYDHPLTNYLPPWQPILAVWLGAWAAKEGMGQGEGE